MYLYNVLTVAVTRALLGWAPIGEEKLQIFMERNENVIMENFVVIFFLVPGPH